MTVSNGGLCHGDEARYQGVPAMHGIDEIQGNRWRIWNVEK